MLVLPEGIIILDSQAHSEWGLPVGAAPVGQDTKTVGFM